MIISASRRTDIPAFFMEWFCGRLREGWLLTRNPMNSHQVSRIDLSPAVVDAIVFWSKQPGPLLERVGELTDTPFELQFTINPYGMDVEPGIAVPVEERLALFRQLSRRTSPSRVIWRYDPILISRCYPVEFHIRSFEEMASWLDGAAKHCVISFVDSYRSTRRNGDVLQLLNVDEAELRRLAHAFGETAQRHGLDLRTCAERIDLSEFGIGHGSCIDAERIAGLLGGTVRLPGKDPNQRQECGCIESVDVGAYNTCGHGCQYCYANYNPAVIESNLSRHCPESPLLFGELTQEDRVSQRRMVSYRDGQLQMF